MIILGIDPGLRRTGWGVISFQTGRLSFIACGAIATDSKWTMPERLSQLYDSLAHVIDTYKPSQAALEETFVSVNGSSTLKLGQARGALMLTLSLAGLPVFEYSATQVKKTVVGAGRAEKQQIIMMVNMLLPGACAKQPDAADALAIAICHAHHHPASRIMAAT